MTNTKQDSPFASTKFGMQISIASGRIAITKDGRTILISSQHKQYVRDVVTGFEAYFDSVENENGVVDFSQPKYQKVKGYDAVILMPSFCESFSIIKQYLDFSRLKPGMIVFDLGAYSGLTSIMFSRAVGESGCVIAAEPDPNNYKIVCTNTRATLPQNIFPIECAVWNYDQWIPFSAESNMGAAAVDYVGERGKAVSVKALKLSTIANYFKLKKVDFIKCDIEGAERVIFRDAEFFEMYKPRIIVEPHNIKGASTIPDVAESLLKYGYSVKIVNQVDSRLPLLECEISR